MQTTVTNIYWPDRATRLARPLFMVSVSAGLPSPAEDYIEGKLDLNRHLIKHPAATFFVRVSGDSMIEAGIHTGDLLVVDRSLEAVDGNVIVAALDGELTVKRLYTRGKALRLLPANSNYTLYGDMSQRVMETLEQFCPDLEIYSIDEAFLSLSGFPSRSPTEYGRTIRSTVKRWTGLPVSVGIAETKTLAKIANRVAKR